MKETKQIAILCFLSDVGLSLWSYFKLTSFEHFKTSIQPYIDSPDFQLQVYQIVMQSFTFTLLLFLSFHLIIYILLWKEKKYAIKYIRFYSFMAALSALLMIYPLQAYIAVVPLIIYFMSFKELGKVLKAIPAQKQS
ncbi:MAG: hypothetical protein WC635_12845 [Bacteriovorax sp.]